MSLNLVLLVCFIACSQPIYSVSVPFITKCAISDSKCMKSSAQAVLPIFADGIPDLGIEKLDPIFMKSLDGSSSSLKLKLNDITVTGLKQCLVKKIQFNDDGTKLTVKVLCTVDATGQYSVDGNVLLLNVTGNGKLHAVLRDVLMLVVVDVSEVIGEDSLPHFSIGEWKHSYELKNNATVELENLFNGNELLARTAKELISQNPNAIIVEVGPEIIKTACGNIIKAVKKFFDIVPKSELVL